MTVWHWGDTIAEDICLSSYADNATSFAQTELITCLSELMHLILVFAKFSVVRVSNLKNFNFMLKDSSLDLYIN